MLRRLLASAALISAVGWCADFEAVAQPALTDHRMMVSEHTTLRDIGSILTRSFHPVRIVSSHAPDTLLVGESGLFEALVNVEHASLPITVTWEFSDGTAVPGLSARHAFARAGRYRVHVHAANHGSDASKTFEVAVLPNDPK